MKKFLGKNFLLHSDAARRLYHDHAAKCAIIDYHCHLDPKLIAKDHRFHSITDLWLSGDHYKWRALRANGIEERYITGRDTSDWEKFEKWAYTVPYTMRNPLYHWTHLELKTAFGIDELLNPQTARKIFDECNAQLADQDHSARALIRRYNVEVICTTDDPVDTLEYHRQIKESGFETLVLPTFRPDKLLDVSDPSRFNRYIAQLAETSGKNISSQQKLVEALRKRHDYFAEHGCKLSDHGIEEFYDEDYDDADIDSIFNQLRNGHAIDAQQVRQYRTAMLQLFASMDHEKGWVQQYHYGAMRNNNSRMFELLGPDAGFDSIGFYNTAKALSGFLNKMNAKQQLSRTIIYNLNPSDNEMIATMIGNFQDGTIPGKIQFGSGWWFLDQKDGMEKQLNALSLHGLLSRFVGMLTDSRSFVSYVRHEYFRRILCNLVGDDLQSGELPEEEYKFIASMIEDICYNNAKQYFNF